MNNNNNSLFALKDQDMKGSLICMFLEEQSLINRIYAVKWKETDLSFEKKCFLLAAEKFTDISVAVSHWSSLLEAVSYTTNSLEHASPNDVPK